MYYLKVAIPITVLLLDPRTGNTIRVDTVVFPLDPDSVCVCVCVCVCVFNLPSESTQMTDI